MRPEDYIGDVLALDGQSCRILGMTPEATAGRATLFAVSLVIEAAAGSHRHRVIPLIASPEPGTRPARIVRPSTIFDEHGETVAFPRPFHENIDRLDWIGIDGQPHRLEGGWPRPITVRTEADRIRAALDVPPGLDELEALVGGRPVRTAGVPLVEVEGPNVRDRDPRDILSDAIARLAELRSRRAPPRCIELVEELIAPVEG